MGALKHVYEHAFAQATIRDPQMAHRPQSANRFQNGTATQNQIGALPPNAGLRSTLLQTHASKRTAMTGQCLKVHRDPINRGPVIAGQAKMESPQSRYCS